ncbi:ABC transporter permease [Candidatus Gracilibacteria bacterium]|nr:ABC transporter permease [Candidatus Gracilibacteria bacterium]
MNIVLTIKLALRGLFLNKMRAFLTVLGVIIGVSGIIVIVSVGNGAESLIVNQIKSIGSNLIGILPGSSEKGEPPAALFGIEITTLKNDDILGLKSIPHIVAVTGFNKTVKPVIYRNKKNFTTITGVFPSFPDVEDVAVEDGRFFNESDDSSLQKVAVLGSDVKDELFEKEPPLGKQIKINNQSFRVIGVLEKRGSSGLTVNDSQVFIPIQTMQKLIVGQNHLSAARVKVDSGEHVEEAVANVESVLRTRHGINNPEDDDFLVSSQAQGLNTLMRVTGSIKLFLAAIAFIALIVGGIGIMNVMYIAVTERTREIGLRKALGARRNDILRQFLLEAIVITGVGGIIGIIIGIIVSFIIAIIMQSLNYSWDYIVTVDSVLYASLIIAGIGIVFGFDPARRAAKLNAIEALRYE